MRKHFLVVAIAAAALTGCASGETDTSSLTGPEAVAKAGSKHMTRLETAEDYCFKTASATLVKDGGMSMELDTKGEKDYDEIGTVTPEGIGCVLGSLDSPDYVVTMITRTTSLMGVQDAEWDGIKASWTYHPDNGLSMLLVDSK